MRAIRTVHEVTVRSARCRAGSLTHRGNLGIERRPFPHNNRREIRRMVTNPTNRYYLSQWFVGQLRSSTATLFRITPCIKNERAFHRNCVSMLPSWELMDEKVSFSRITQ